MVKSYHESRKPRQKPLRKRLVGWGVLVALVFVVGLVIGYLKTTEEPQPEPVAETAVTQRTREVLLYFAAVDGQSLVAETRDINECEQEEDCLSDTVRELIAGPQGALAAVLPKQVELHGVAIVGSQVNVDFSQELITAHPGGTQSELLTIYGLTDTLAVNFPHLRQVKILVDGVPVATLKGHVDLRQPVTPDFSMVEEGSAPVGRLISLPAGSEE